ncbi:MAG: substrate-binding domain-containing protein [Firmicutes bacterium]|nr:substrate-binding domain-containing protein [Bacillota bacterium]MCL1954141.1 substrate-binding domain-containing protein [Bacillota bacterium]
MHIKTKRLRFLLILSLFLSISIILVACISDFREDRIIQVVSRDSSSGTRKGLEQALYGEEKVSLPKGDSYEVVASEAAVISSVRSNPQAIGYEGLGFINTNYRGVNKLSVDGVLPDEDSLRDNSYKLSRPLSVVYRLDKINANRAAKAFLDFINSKDGSDIVKQQKYVVDDTLREPYQYVPDLSGAIKIAGSTTVEPLIQRLAVAFKDIQPNINMDNIHATGSGASISAMQDNTHDFGMYSAEISDSLIEEMQSGDGDYIVEKSTIALDAIVIIVHATNYISNISVEQLKHLYSSNSGLTFNNWKELINYGG